MQQNRSQCGDYTVLRLGCPILPCILWWAHLPYTRIASGSYVFIPSTLLQTPIDLNRNVHGHVCFSTGPNSQLHTNIPRSRWPAISFGHFSAIIYALASSHLHWHRRFWWTRCLWSFYEYDWKQRLRPRNDAHTKKVLRINDTFPLITRWADVSQIWPRTTPIRESILNFDRSRVEFSHWVGYKTKYLLYQ